MKNLYDNISAPNKPDTDQAIIEYITSHSDQSQGDIVKALMEQLSLGRSTLSERIKQLREAGQLDFWANSPAKGKREVTSSASVEPFKGNS
ncbi:winged helix-turn-helix domain-containing protein [Desulfovibrio sp. QI0442]